ncbi:MAG: Gfo/Idh/MocA family oxidoreductase [Ruminococcaceae bacterium]|nr:Gfo/Idh/MocA family oxidoreductase [Oscillospiraceae bacterium]
MVRLGVVGLGSRGKGWIAGVLVNMENVTITALCDVYMDRVDDCANIVTNKHPDTEILKTTDYRELIDADCVDAVLCTAAWEAHVPVSIYSMRAGKPVGCEVGGAYSVEDCWDLVRTYEETGTKFMFLENCCYGRRELMILNMVERGFFGKVVHCDGGYHHDLREEISFGKENRHYRLRNYLSRNCENYPTHELGPIAKILNINHGNRMVSLTSTASLSAGLSEYIKNKKPDDEELKNANFAQGDMITTVIKCAHGETITLQLDTTLPRYYTRDFTVHGTRALYEERTDSIFEDGKHNHDDWSWTKNFGNAKEYAKEYEHPIWKDYLENGLIGGHGGMDGLVMHAFIDSLENDKPCPIDVYDAAAWMSVTALSSISVSLGGAPVEVPDFTRGQWLLR